MNSPTSTVALADWQLRVIEEKRELDEKLQALTTFIGSKQFAKLDDTNRSLLLSQREWMFRYSDVLEQRINLFIPAYKLQDPTAHAAVTDVPPQE